MMGASGNHRAARVVGVAVWLFCLWPLSAGLAEGQLASTKIQKAAVKCQNVVAQVGAKVVTGKFKALDACANAALTCVQTKYDQGDPCLAKAGATCTKKLKAATAALDKAQAKIFTAKSCAVEIPYLDLLNPNGLGMEQITEPCQRDFNINICGGLDQLATCLRHMHESAAGALYGEVRPRTGELLNRLPSVFRIPVDGLLPSSPCASCSEISPNPKGVEQCGKALTKATHGMVVSLEKVFGACAQTVLACVQAKHDRSKCLPAAIKGCDAGVEKINAAFTKFKATVVKQCTAPEVYFGQLADAAGDSLAALGCPSAPVGSATLAACVQQRGRCRIAELLQHAVPRVRQLQESGRLGSLGADLMSTCATQARSPQSPLAPRQGVFGSISKIIKLIRRPRAPLIPGAIRPGGRPNPTTGGRPGITTLGGSPRIRFGGISKIPFRYTIGGSRSPSSIARVGDAPPTLIVTVRRNDAPLDDHFEIALDPAPAAPTEVEDELEVTYQNTLPGCAFTLELAIREDAVVSDYAPLEQVVDATVSSRSITRIMAPSGNGIGDPIDGPFGLAVDGPGNVFVVGSNSHNVFKISPGGAITLIADQFSVAYPSDVGVDGDGNVFVASGGGAGGANVKIRPDGMITNFIGPDGDGAGNWLTNAEGLTVDGDGNVFLTGLAGNNAFKVTPGGVITAIITGSGDGAGHALARPYGIAADAAGNVYLVGFDSDNAFKIAPGGTISQIIDASGDGAGHVLDSPSDVAVDGAGNVYVSGRGSDNVFKITATGTITQIIDGSGDGAGHLFDAPRRIAVAEDGTVYVPGTGSDNVFAITPQGSITQILDANGDGAGNGLDAPIGIAVDGAGNAYVAGLLSDNVFKVSPGQ